MRTIQILVLFIFYQLKAQYSDPNISKPSSGYGTDGTHTIGVISFPNPNYPTKDIVLYYPSDVTTKVPTIFYNHAYGGYDPSNIIGMLNFVARKGYAIVFVPYQTVGVTIQERYANLLHGFRLAARSYPDIIDTTKVGFMGYSFGGGATFANAYACFSENNWGANGRFMYTLAQWYSYNISQLQLQSFPSDVKVLIEVFDDDETNDHRLAIDIFNTINIDESEKDFLLVKSDTINSYIYSATHSLPNTFVAWDALDYYAYYRFIDALADYTFNGSAAGKLVALGAGSAEQITMPGGLKNLEQTDAPVARYEESKYVNPCNDVQNPRSEYCSLITSHEDTEANNLREHIFPNPVTEEIRFSVPAGEMNTWVFIYDSQGKEVLKVHSGIRSSINVAALTPGLYILKSDKLVKTFIKE